MALAAAFAAGIWAADWLRPHPLLPLAGLAAAACTVALSARRGQPPPAGALLMAALLAGALRHATPRWVGPGALRAYVDRPVEVVGTVLNAGIGRSGPEMVVRAEAVRLLDGTVRRAGPVPVREPLHVTWRAPAARGAPGSLPAPGRRVRVRGVPVVPPLTLPGIGEDLRRELARRGIFLTVAAWVTPEDAGPGATGALHRWAQAARERLRAVTERWLSAERAALLAGLVLGDREGIPDRWRHAFRLTGVYHVLAASGGNVALVTGPLAWALSRLGAPRRAAALAVVPAIWAYSVLAGSGPPVLRAGVAATLHYAGQAQGRRSDGYSSLAAATLVLLAAAPGMLFDLGFQLSFLATLGILALGPPIASRLGRYLFPAVAAPLAVTLAAGAAVEPLLLSRFGYVTLISPLANLWVGLVVLALVPLAAFGMGLGLIHPLLAAPALRLAGGLTGLLTGPLEGLAELPLAGAPIGPPGPAALALYYAALAAWRWRTVLGDPVRRAAGRLLRPGPALAGFALLAGAGVASAIGPALPSFTSRERLEACFLHVGPGAATVLRLPGGEAVLVDAGPARPNAGVDAGRDVVVLFLRRQGVRRLDLAVVTSARQGEAGGMATVLATHPVAELWTPQVNDPPRAWLDVRDMARVAGVPVRLVSEAGGPQRWEPRPGVRLAAWPAPEAPGVPDGLLVQVEAGALAVRIAGAAAAASGPPGAWRSPAVVQVTAKGESPASALPAGARVVIVAGQAPTAGSGSPRVPGASAQYRTERHGTVCVRGDPASGALSVRTQFPGLPGEGGRLLGTW
ncbi:ComEC/Rec2 family competence protein [Caldinitratiruptor microaerophilus]|uniref:Competence protein ComEC n=1 Tax=Caldinitratiruptor microaerophilus TaxID=671077 RepID=A0AA35CLD5_9FIRM|nr:ComEC/Rec2 family competence protein [Caldinitratiruptor microaerophilus]BDG61454.1 hypothetical protein caldi_25440 [Caldinitratiruptor microaerophilus]